MSHGHPDAAEKLRLALELFEFGEGLYRQKLRRQHPEWTSDAIEEALSRWLDGPEPHRPPWVDEVAP